MNEPRLCSYRSTNSIGQIQPEDWLELQQEAFAIDLFEPEADTDGQCVMEKEMRQFLLAMTLIAVAIGVFALGRSVFPSNTENVSTLGDLTAMQTIVSDVQDLVQADDLVAAKSRIADLETAWDDAEPALRPLDTLAWGFIDDATDGALKALRAKSPDITEVGNSLKTLAAALNDQKPATKATAGVTLVGNIAVTDENGHALPCEEMLATVRKAMIDTPPPEARAAAIRDLVAKATERCNADDDQNADVFSATALQSLATH